MKRDDWNHLAMIFSLGVPAAIILWPWLSPFAINIAAAFAIAWSSGFAIFVSIAFAQGFTKGLPNAN